MEKKIDEAAVWQRVSGASAEGMQSSSPPVLVLPELMELLSDMERCSALLSRMDPERRSRQCAASADTATTGDTHAWNYLLAVRHAPSSGDFFAARRHTVRTADLAA